MPKKLSFMGAAACMGACSAPLCPSAMQPGEQGRIVRIIDGDALVLHTGQSVRLVGIDAPQLTRPGEPQDDNALKSKRYLEDLALGREVQLCYPGLTRDRYDRALAHVVTTDQLGPPRWLNRDSVAAGMARVRLFPDTLGAVETLYAAETQARKEVRGLWKSAAYQLLAAKDISPNLAGFTLVQASFAGPALPLPGGESATNACRRAVAGSDLIIQIDTSARALCAAPADRPYLMRGWLANGQLRIRVEAHARPIVLDEDIPVD